MLIVEDERTLALEIEAFLKKESYICDFARNANDALQKVGINEYDFVLLDLGLPDQDGLSVLREAKKINPDPIRL